MIWQTVTDHLGFSASLLGFSKLRRRTGAKLQFARRVIRVPSVVVDQLKCHLAG